MTASTAGTKGVPRAKREKQIIEIASRHFAKNGFANTSVIPIAEESGISKPLIYIYFDSKQGLYAACLRAAGELLIAEGKKIGHLKADSVTRPVATLEAIFATLENRQHLWSLLFDQTAPEEWQHLARTYRQYIYDSARTGVTNLMREIGMNDDLDISIVTEVWVAIASSLLDWWSHHPEMNSIELSERSRRVVFGLIGVSGEN